MATSTSARASGKSVADLCAQWAIRPEIQKCLEDMKVSKFFPVQIASIPQLLDVSHDRIHDICISAPTGSGKTLVYVVPIVQRLSTRIVCRLRALIVLPSRDLAIQVHGIVSKFCQSLDKPLKCGLAIGQSNFSVEQETLVGPLGDASTDANGMGASRTGAGGVSAVDILVATPGRLVDHLEQTPGFTLQHLQFLIVDEADRLLNQSYQDWIAKVYASVFADHSEQSRAQKAFASFNDLFGVTSRRADSIDRRRIKTPLTRVLLSATLTRNPRKLAAIGMSHAELTKIGRMDDDDEDDNLDEEQESEEVSGDDGDAEDDGATTNPEVPTPQKASKHDEQKLYATPKNLAEYMIECDAGSKPLILLELLHDFSDSLSVVFTSSVNSTHRLCRLLQLFFGSSSSHSSSAETPQLVVREFSSSLTQKQRSMLVADCKRNKVQVIVCSDAMARGMDIDNVANVVNYDVPSFLKTYIHRVGRTARAGRHGNCVTLVKKGQRKMLFKMLKKAENNLLQPYALDASHLQLLIPTYKESLSKLQQVMALEQAGHLKATSPHIERAIAAAASGKSSSADQQEAETSATVVPITKCSSKRLGEELATQLAANLNSKRVKTQ